MLYINTELLDQIDFKNRFDAQKFMPFTNDVYDLLDSYFLRKVKSLPIWGQTRVKGEEARPDLISYRIYNKTVYWQIIMIYNNYTAVEDIVEGDTIKYPSIDDVEELYFSLNALQKTNDIAKVIE